MSSQFPARNQVAIVGYAQTDITKHADQPLGALALGAATKAIGDAGLTTNQIDGFTSSALFPSAGSHAVVDGISTVSSTWLAQRLGVNPRYASGFQGYGQMPGSVALAVNAMYRIDGLWLAVLAIQAPSVTNTFLHWWNWFHLLSMDVFGSFPIRHPPISCMSLPGAQWLS